MSMVRNFHRRRFARRRSILSTTGLVGIAALSALAVSPRIAYAQSAGTVELKTIVVEADSAEDPKGPVDGFVASRSATGTKTNASILETPASISVVTEDQIEQQGAQSVQDALRYTPGVSADIRPQGRYDIVPVRGFGGYQNFVQYMDGLRMLKGIFFAQPTVDISELERVEVLRGPASVLYGQVSPGGIVNLVTKHPRDERIREAEVGVSYPYGANASFDLGDANDAGTFMWRVTGVGRYNETNIDDMNTARMSVSPSVTFKPGDDTTLTLLAGYFHDPESAYPQRLPAAGTAYANGSFPDIPYDFDPGDADYEKFDRTMVRFGWEFEHAFNEVLTARQNFRYTYIDTDQRSITSAGTYAAPPSTTINRVNSAIKEDVRTIAVDNQLEGKFMTGAAEHTVLGGFDYQYTDADALFGRSAAPGIDYTNPDYSTTFTEPARTLRHRRLDQAGFYVQEQMRWDRLAATIGGRLDWYRDEYDITSDYQKQEDHAFTWRAGLAYLFDNGITPYASYSTSFEPPAGLGTGNVALDPVTAQQYEIGVKYQPPGSKSYVGIAAFDLTQQNVLVQDSGGGPFLPLYRQTDEWHTRGIELEAKANLGRGWDVIAAYTYLDAEISESTAGTQGNTPATVPTHTASLWGHYTFQNGHMEGLGLGAGVRYQGSSWGDDANSFKVDSFALFDAALDYDFSALSSDYEGTTFRLNVQNVFDKEYVSSCSDTSACFYGTGRIIQASFHYKW